MLLEGKVGIVTGAGMGMGEAVARRWAREGARVIATDVNDEAGHASVEAITAAGGEAHYVHADISSEDDWQAVTAYAVNELGGLNIVHNNAAVHFWFDSINDPMEKWDQMMAINLRGVLLGCRYAIRHMITAGGGAIVNTSSVSALHGVPLQGLYGSTKAGVINLTRSLARAYGPPGRARERHLSGHHRHPHAPHRRGGGGGDARRRRPARRSRWRHRSHARWRPPRLARRDRERRHLPRLRRGLLRQRRLPAGRRRDDGLRERQLLMDINFSKELDS